MERKGQRVLQMLIAARRLGAVCACLAVWCWCVAPVGAVVIAGGDGSGNATSASIQSALSGFDYFNNVGQQATGSGVYLGNGWAITAVHIRGVTGGVMNAPNNLIINGTTVSRDESVALVRLVNGDGSPADLVMYKLQDSPVLNSLPTVTIGTASPTVGSSVVMLGVGRDREPGLTSWDINFTVPPDTDVWTETSPGPGVDATGFKWVSDANSRTLRWGTNVVNNTNQHFDSQNSTGTVFFGTVVGFDTVFTLNGGGNEAQAGPGDSSGAVFANVNGDWELVGIMSLTGTIKEGQPAETVVFNSSVTVISDLTLLRDQIVPRLIPEPSTVAVMGLLGLALIRRRPRR